MERFNPIHVHLLVKGFVSNPITDPELAKLLLQDLVHVIDMKPVTQPQSVYVNDLGNEGLTGSINLASSHICYHIWDDTGLMMADVYSCKDFDINVVIQFFKDNFNMVATHDKPILYKIIDRNDEKEYDHWRI